MIGMTVEAIRGRLLQTGQTTPYFRGDDGALQKGLGKFYEIYTVGQYAGTVNLDVAHYAAPTISFAAPNILADAGAGLVTFLTNDTIVVKGSPANDGTYVVSNGGVAGQFNVAPNVVDEGAGAYVSLYKRAAHSNNVVWDRRTGLYWSRTTSSAEKVGPTSNGLLNWVDAATSFTLHPAAGDLQLIASTPPVLRIVGGAGEIARYHAGGLLVLSGFAGGNNNIPGFYVVSAAVNGADLDITLDDWGVPVIAEAAGGARAIKLVCQSAFNYMAAARTASLGGYTDWRIPNIEELATLTSIEGANSVPDTTAFPGWPAVFIQTSGTPANLATWGFYVAFAYGDRYRQLKTATAVVALIRG